MMAPPFFCSIVEIRENPLAQPYCDINGLWLPGLGYGENIIDPAFPGSHYYCNGQRLVQYSYPELPEDCKHYKTFSVYYSDGRGFWILRGNATDPRTLDGDAWHPLMFDYPNLERGHSGDGSSFLTNAGQHHRLYVQRSDQRWPHLLLPDIYHASPCYFSAAQPQYGGLQGELPIFLALMALSIPPHQVTSVLPMTMADGVWRTHQQKQPWIPRRGVMVSVYIPPPSYGVNSQALAAYENGAYGNYFN